MTPLNVSVADAAVMLGVSEWQVRRYIEDGLLPVVQLPSSRRPNERGRRVLISVEDLKAFCDRYRVPYQPNAGLSEAALKREGK